MKKIPFVKMQGAGNDYVYINAFEESVDDPSALAQKISDRHFGVGSDGLVLICPSQKADLRMRMFNSDGSEAEMCGNASRCVAKFAYEHGLVKKPEFTLETGAGIKNIFLQINDDTIREITVDMGEPVFDLQKIPFAPAESQEDLQIPLRNYPQEVKNCEWKITPLGMGNPHAVIFTEQVENMNLPELGPEFEHHKNFPARTNTEFVSIISPTHIKMRVWERGAGETLACGTGACAALVASALNGLTKNEADVELAGGILHIKWDRSNNHVYMSGPAETVFEGVYFA